MKDKTGGPAFPCEINLPEQATTEKPVEYKGMTLLDYFAGKAMKEILVGGGWSEYDNLASESYKIASAMLKEREKWV
jgi:hypothetical protein